MRGGRISRTTGPVFSYNGSSESSRNGRRHRSKMILRRRAEGNGVKKAHVTSIATPAHDAPVERRRGGEEGCRRCKTPPDTASRTATRDTTPSSWNTPPTGARTCSRSADPPRSRSTSPSSTRGSPLAPMWFSPPVRERQRSESSAGNNAALHRQSVRSSSVERSSVGGVSDLPRPISSTISRYACRILVDRDNLSKARIYAAGFDSSRNIALGVSLRSRAWAAGEGNQVDEEERRCGRSHHQRHPHPPSGQTRCEWTGKKQRWHRSRPETRKGIACCTCGEKSPWMATCSPSGRLAHPRKEENL